MYTTSPPLPLCFFRCFYNGLHEAQGYKKHKNTSHCDPEGFRENQSHIKPDIVLLKYKTAIFMVFALSDFEHHLQQCHPVLICRKLKEDRLFH